MPTKASKNTASSSSGATHDNHAATPTKTAGSFIPESVRTVTWEENMDKFFYFAPNSGKREKKSFMKNGKQVNTFLFNIEGVDCNGGRILIEVWGDRQTELFDKFFTRAAATGDSDNVFRLQNTDEIPDTDAESLILIPHEPNEFQQRYRKVYKLQTKKKAMNVRSKIVKLAFPKPVTWRDEAFTYADGTEVPPPDTWAEVSRELDESNLDFETLFEFEEIEAPAAKRQRVEE